MTLIYNNLLDPLIGILTTDKKFGIYEYILQRLHQIPGLSKHIIEDTATITLDKKYKLKQIGIPNCGGLFVVDVIYMDHIKETRSTVIDGIPYIRIKELVKDLKTTIVNRRTIVSRQQRFGLSRSEENYNLQIEKIKNTLEQLKNIYFNIDRTSNIILECDDSKESKRKSEKVNRILKKKVNEIRDTFEMYTKMANVNNFKLIKEKIDEFDHVKTKLARTQARLATLLSAMQMGKGLSSGFIKDICVYCHNNLTSSIELAEGIQTQCSDILRGCQTK